MLLSENSEQTSGLTTLVYLILSLLFSQSYFVLGN